MQCGKVKELKHYPKTYMQLSYSIEIEKQMQEVFDRLSEKDKRLYAGVEALKFPYGGISYIAQLFSCSRTQYHSARDK